MGAVRPRVVITGVGAVSPFGAGAVKYFQGLREGRSAIRRLSLFQDAELASQVAAEVPDFDPLDFMEPADTRRVPRLVPMAIGAAREAAADAGIDPEKLDLEGKRDIGVLVGTGGGGIDFAERQYEEFYGNRSRHLTPYSVSSSFVGMLSSEISIALGFRGISHVISTGCTSSTDAIGYAFDAIRSGRQERLLTGGAEACITPGIMAAFCRMKVISTRYNDAPEKASRPFDGGRDGFVLGEGAWMFLLESLESAEKRGAKIYAEILGYGSTCDAYHRVAVPNDGVESARAMMLALEDAGASPGEIQYINLHGTGTKMNDPAETAAVKLVFRENARRIPASSVKSQIGHPQGACGAAGVMASLFALKEQFIPPTLNCEIPDPDCDLDYTPNRG
ncbi:MAG: beta-ketoacyl-[acyl-carrier-protein] synthase family protein, partial [Methylocella sp.]